MLGSEILIRCPSDDRDKPTVKKDNTREKLKQMKYY